MKEKDLWDLPDPFRKEDGTRVDKKEDWPVQRQYLRNILTEWLYGQMPPPPGNVKADVTKGRLVFDGRGIREDLVITCGPGERIKFRVILIRPNTQDKSIPVIVPRYVSGEVVEDALKEGFCILIYNPDDGAPDDEGYKRGSCYQCYSEYSWKEVAMWAWLASRVIDYLEEVNFADIEKVIMAGHSRYGKTALCCAVYDTRVSMCAAAGSGAGGMSCLRHLGSRVGENTGFFETSGWLMREGGAPRWFADSFGRYGSKEAPCTKGEEYRLPFDAHFIPAVIAPRPFLQLEGLDDLWCNPYGSYISWMAGAEVYDFLGEAEQCGIHYREGGHEFGPRDWNILRNFAKSCLCKKQVVKDYKTMNQIEIKYGYSWRCPGVRDASVEDFFAVPFRHRKIEWGFTD